MVRTLTIEGEKEFGDLFRSGVPVVYWTPCYANLQGREGNQLVFLVDWTRLTDKQKTKCVEYMSKKFDVDGLRIRKRIDSDGFFPIQHKYVIESYDMRHFI